MLIEPFADYLPRDFIFKVATTRDELAGYHALRRAVFCEEQHVFTGQDHDLIDACAMPIICATLIAGMTDEVVGAVRIDERAPRLWYGSRLCVHAAYRKLPQLTPELGSGTICLFTVASVHSEPVSSTKPSPPRTPSGVTVSPPTYSVRSVAASSRPAPRDEADIPAALPLPAPHGAGLGKSCYPPAGHATPWPRKRRPPAPRPPF